jgi:hypothetical protein
MDEMGLIDFAVAFHPTAANYTFFSASHGTFSKTDHSYIIKQISTNIKNLNNSLVLTDHNGIKLEINGKENYK